VEALSVEQINSKEADISDAQEEINTLQAENISLSSEIEERSDGLQESLKENHDKRQSLLHYQAEFNQKIKTLVKETKFYEENDTCPTCTQDISSEVRDAKLATAKEKATELNSAVRDVSEKSLIVESAIERLTNTAGEIRDKTSIITSNNKTISRLQEQIKSINNSIEQIRGSGGDLSKSRSELETLKKLKDDLFEKRLYLNESLSYNSIILEMLKDTGIKTKIIKQYLPVINKLVNQYLQVLDFFVSFNLDESFSETIRSRHRDNFSYDSFSEGEKQRIDLALLFTWRHIAKMKNSVSTNLLILDETFDSSLDYEGVDNLMKIIHTLDDDTNIFVISHKGDILDGKFQNKLEFHKEKNFSKLKGS
jgi:DNA repair exonuclease SbcCD ATPase subunit